MNKAILIGNLTKDIELRTTPNGKQVASTSMATNKSYKDANGIKQQVATFHNLVIWGKQAEVIAQYAGKGSKIAVEGEINNRSYDDRDGNKKYISEIIVREFEFLDSKPKEEKEETQETQEDEIRPEDIPF
jgi:single-strand DNA-binding protein